MAYYKPRVTEATRRTTKTETVVGEGKGIKIITITPSPCASCIHFCYCGHPQFKHCDAFGRWIRGGQGHED